MLPRALRLTQAADFRRTIRAGHKARTSTVLVHGLLQPGSTAPRAGVTVNKAVGGSVTRHYVARAIRHALADALTQAPEGSMWVVRALPPAGDRAFGHQVARDVQRGFAEILESARSGR